MIPEPTEASIRIARDTVSRDPIFKTATDIHGRAIESAIYRVANSEVARCYLRLVAAREPEAGELREALEHAFVKGADVAVFLANQRQNPQPPSTKQLDEIADFIVAVRTALSRNQGR